ncbi:hypothetical protein Pelo_18727 [Pelomyxa schiedti]|nr:hypothetical protein Pelo_18727 [Pelomyxa schiedti]
MSTTSAVWTEVTYYEMTGSLSDSTSCNNVIYVDVELTSSCTEDTICSWGYDYNYKTVCHDVMPAIDSYFDDPYWSDDCNGKDVTHFVVAKDTCVFSTYMTSYRGWTCNKAIAELYKTANYDDSTCAEGYAYDLLTPWGGYRHGECFYSSGSGYFSLDCEAAATPTADYQLITYHAISSDVGACDGTTAILGYEYYYTDDCNSYDCVAGPEWMETWSSVMR